MFDGFLKEVIFGVFGVLVVEVGFFCVFEVICLLFFIFVVEFLV